MYLVPVAGACSFCRQLRKLRPRVEASCLRELVAHENVSPHGGKGGDLFAHSGGS